ncbi:SMP-30/gluconolactonase/LRE family protein [Limoniibacter endophyticus]|uniref:SMP-30/Gluconolactonase/LRE-like region domain-containing protein n=1 Tax=Limoniibacter endophyticus TaxID=1565040 RepID=A0A8J3GHZ3_9HYPH|nr:SMP-30/gluconolactonase/LRE family protein [Limoniibacter endophyticus]GHC78130.1 hypothetical protein GCM10010136_29820 [Limoniibacter endophyticus]
MPVKIGDFEIAAQTLDIIGEVPLWDHRIQRLSWIDIFKPALHRLDPVSGEVESFTPPEKLGAYALTKGDDVLTGGRGGIGRWIPRTGEFLRLAEPETDMPDNILNDGRTDPRGRFLIGSMNKRLSGATGKLWRIDPDERVVLLQDEDIWLPNSICWSPDGSTFYMGDSHSNTIFAYDYDLTEGAISNRRVFAETADLPGDVDGSSVDAEGYVWNARFGGGCIVRFAPDGSVDQIIETPVSRPAHLAFGGPDLKTIYLTTATFRLSPEELAKEPWAGAVLRCECGVSGLKETIWG